MKKSLTYSFILVLVPCLYSLPTCAQVKPDKATAKKMIGSWTLNKMEFQVNEEKATEEEKGMGQMMGMFSDAFDSLKGSVKYTFNKNGTYEMLDKNKGGNQENGRWKLEGKRLITQSSDGEGSSENTITMISFEDKSLVMSAKASEGMYMVVKFIR